MKIIAAPNSFKHSINAIEAAEAIEKGLKQSRLNAEVVRFPIADGGDHTLITLMQHMSLEKISSKVKDPLGREIDSFYGFDRNGKTAVIELALASGIQFLKESELDPMRASTYGTGQLMDRALQEGAREIFIGVGGSATVDGGAGLLQALGCRLLNKDDQPIKPGGEGLLELERIDMEACREKWADVDLAILCDVDNPLLGEQGAAKVFGPQKGADENKVGDLEKGLQKLADATRKAVGKDVSGMRYGGASGGVPAALHGLLDARLVSGIDFVLEKGGFEKHAKDAGVLITAEGKIDEQTLSGKGPAGVAKAAKKHGLMTIGLSGMVKADFKNTELFDAVFPIGKGPQSLEEALENTYDNLEAVSAQVGNLIAAAMELRVHAF